MTKTVGRANRGDRLVLTCEHAGNQIPDAYAKLFRGAGKLLASHRGWDPGAWDFGRALADQLGIPLEAVFWSRLLVESNRSPTNPRIWSTFTARLPSHERAEILDRYWRPHREKVTRAVEQRVRGGYRVIHLAVHSFTDELDGDVRNADIGLLYDSRRKAERAWCQRWEQELHRENAGWRIRRNYPYLGKADGLTTALRKQFSERTYLGVELELRQGLLSSSGCGALQQGLAASLRRMMPGAF